ncbi:PAS domain-containing protein [Pseudomonas sp. HLS-6]|uniref:PAS domain-containing protein n=1 Tax=Pseudomonas sp. HLS-6 TaxID=2049589 RepID=UPI000C187F9C|nr:PAS domain-containing protein [Pseudomonas sp. HLS-6]
MFNSRLKKALQDQSAELYMLRQLIEQMNRGMLSIRLDAQTRICDFNPHFAQTLGYKDEHLRGRPLSEIVPPYVTECVKTPGHTLAMISENFIAREAHETVYPG